MSTVKSKNLQVGTDATASNNFTIYQPSSPDGTLRIGVGNADSPTEVGRFNSSGYVATNAPAFSAYASTSNTVSATVYTKVQLNTEKFDLTNNFDNATNYRFTPSVEGYYQINTKVRATSSTNTLDLVIVAIYKNGAAYESVQYNPDNSYSEECAFSTLVYLNGSTDYIELYSSIYGSGTLSQNSVNSALSSAMSGYLVRAT